MSAIPNLGEGAATREFGCRYSVAWVGRCNAIAVDDGLCGLHLGRLCTVCGEQSTNECSHTGQFVCGAPLCGNCEGWVDTSKYPGAWGFMNHDHRRKPVEKRKHETRAAVAADFGITDATGESK